jgi:uncharacterized NAD-dependent epimerase/dehydratase family protein
MQASTGTPSRAMPKTAATHVAVNGSALQRDVDDASVVGVAEDARAGMLHSSWRTSVVAYAGVSHCVN